MTFPITSRSRITQSAPSGNPSPGRFAWKGCATKSCFSIKVPSNKFYGVHVDLMHVDVSD